MLLTGWCQPLPATALSWHGYTCPHADCPTLPDKVAGLDAEFDDYVVKPIELQLPRIRALLRRGSSSRHLRFSGELVWTQVSMESPVEPAPYMTPKV